MPALIDRDQGHRRVQLVGAVNVVSAIVDFRTWLHLVWSAISVALFVWIFLLPLGVWRRERRRRASRSGS